MAKNRCEWLYRSIPILKLIDLIGCFFHSYRVTCDKCHFQVICILIETALFHDLFTYTFKEMATASFKYLRVKERFETLRQSLSKNGVAILDESYELIDRKVK